MGPNRAAQAHVYKPVVLVLMGLIFFSLLVKIFFHKHLSADGVAYFLHILDYKDIIRISAARRSSELLTQWPLVLSVNAGLRNIPILVYIFGLGILLPYIISFLACWFALRERGISMMFFPLASYLAINMTGDYLLSGEHQVMVLMSWPILFLLLIDRPLSWVEGALLFGLLGIFCRSYETALIPIIFFLIIIGARLWKFRRGRERIILLIGLVFLLIGFYFSFKYIVVPRSMSQRGSFIDGALRNLKIKEVTYFVPFLFVYLMGWLISSRYNWLKNLLYAVGIAIILGYLYARMTTDYAITSYWSFSSRTLSLLLLPGMLMAATILYFWRRENTKFGRQVFAFGCSMMLIVNLLDLSNWSGFKRQMETILQSETGYMLVPIDGTSLADNDFRWSWNNPALSLVWSYPCVRRIVTNGDGYNGYEPFDPEKTMRLKNFLMFRKEFFEIDPEVEICD